MLAREMPEDDYLFFWQLRPTCVFGRNQDPYAELDLDFCRRHGVDIVRRKSGGGTIFADEDNIMVSLVTGGGPVEPVFGAFTQQIAHRLKSLGAPTMISGRNDICLDDGRKICGGAFYHLRNRNIVHCTMLYDTNMPLMRGCLTPSRAKLESKGVKSVPSRIGLLKEYLPFGANELRRKLGSLLTDRTLLLTEEQARSITDAAEAYRDTAYLYGNKCTDEPLPLLTLSRHVEGCGRIDIFIYAHDGAVSDVRLGGDFFEAGGVPANEAFCKAFVGQPPELLALKAAVKANHPEHSVRGLTEKALLRILSEDLKIVKS